MKKSALLSLLLVSVLHPLSAQIDIEGVSDEGVITNQATLRVVSEAGYDYTSLLNGERIAEDTDIVVERAGYYELSVSREPAEGGVEETELVRFIVRASERGSSEWGLPAFVPLPLINSAPSAFSGAELELVVPKTLPPGVPVPVVARLKDNLGEPLWLNGFVRFEGYHGSALQLFRGFGHAFLPPLAEGETRTVQYRIHGLSGNFTVECPEGVAPEVVDADIAGDTLVEAGAWVRIAGDIDIASGATLTIGAGAIVLFDSGVDIELEGRLEVAGTAEEPVFFLPARPGEPWGGVTVTTDGAEVEAEWLVLTGSGEDENWFSGTDYSTHKSEQAAFLFDGTTGSFANCAFVSLAGQALHGDDATISLARTLIQRVPTAGQFNGGNVSLDRSAIIEVPVASPEFANDDNDGIYFTEGEHTLDWTVVGWTKDDGIDAGSGGAGIVRVRNCWIEATFHEAMAWSGTGRFAYVNDTVAINCGQGIEAGWNSPEVTVDNSVAIANAVGLRFGDNYDWDYDGFLTVTDSISIFNERDIWGREWDTWEYNYDKMDVTGTYFSVERPDHPGNFLWTAANGELLSPFMPLSSAPVGISITEWTGQADLTQLDEPVQVGLSSFSSEPVSVQYRLYGRERLGSDAEVLLDSGELSFTPGEISHAIALDAAVGPDISIARLELDDPVHAEFAGGRRIFFMQGLSDEPEPETLIPTGAVWSYNQDRQDLGTEWRELGYDDSGWSAGPAQLGDGDGDEATELDRGPSGDRTITFYFRHTFEIEDPSQFVGLEISLLRDDGAVIYINGEEAMRSNMPLGAVSYNSFASDATDDEEDLRLATVSADFLRAGANLVAVEVHQANLTSSDVSFDLGLVATRRQRPMLEIEDIDGEIVLLWSASGYALEKAEDVQGPWTRVDGATSPATMFPPHAREATGTHPMLEATGDSAFYRLVEE